MKRSIFWALIISFCVLTLAFIYGCGANPTSSGSSSSGTPNKGTISGYAYVCDHLGGTYTGTPDVAISVSTEAMSLEVITTTDASGKYTLSELPSGLITVTAIGNGYNPQTIAANSSKINFAIKSLGTIETATIIRGTIEGVAAGTSINLRVGSCPLNDLDPPIFFDPTTLTYEVTGAAAGDTYIRAIYGSGEHYHYAYNKITTSSGGTFYINISFEAGVTIDATTISVPSGYTASKMYAMVSKNNHELFRVSDDPNISGTSCKLEGVAPLKSGDSYVVQIWATNEADDEYRKYYFGRSAGSQTFIDNSSLPSQFMVNPASGKFTTAPTTLEWNSVSGANYYMLDLVNTSWEWYIYTAETKITIPPSIASIIPAGETIIGLEARHYAIAPQICDPDLLYLNSPDNYWDMILDNAIYANW